MARKATFFNSMNGDRDVSAVEFSERFKHFFTNGIIVTGESMLADEMKVSAVPGTFNSQIAEGIIVINGFTMHIYDSPEVVTHDAAEPSNERIDRVVLELNLNDDVRDIVPKIVKGIPAISPVAPSLVRTDLVHQISLAKVLIPANVTVIPASNVTDERRYGDVCGISNLKIGINTPTGNEADLILVEDIAGNFSSPNVEGVLEELFTHVSNGKGSLETAITGMRGTVSKQSEVATFAELDTGIKSIPQGKGNATAGTVVAPNTFTNDSGIMETGTIPNRGAGGTVTPATSNQTKYAGYYSSNITIVGDADLISANIKAGKNIFGVAGNSNVVDTSAGTAANSHILSGKKAYVNGALRTGTMTNRGGAVTVTPSTSNQTKYSGYYSGNITIAGDADLISANIKAGKNIFGVAGNSNVVDTSAGTAANSHILSGKKAYVDGALRTGTMTNRGGAVTVTPSTSNQTKYSGYYSGNITIAGDADLISANIKAGKNIFGVAGNSNVVDTSGGTITNANQIRSGLKAYSDGALKIGTMAYRTGGYGTDSLTRSGNQLRLGIPDYACYADSAYIHTTDNDWIESNIRSGKNLFGKTGTLVEGIKSASGKTASTYSSGSYYATVSGLAFTPRIIVLTTVYGRYHFQATYNEGFEYSAVNNFSMFCYNDETEYETRDLKRDWIISSDGFKVSVISGPHTATWEAFE